MQESSEEQNSMHISVMFLLMTKHKYLAPNEVFTEPKKWNDAESDCKVHGGNLVSIHSENYNQWVRALFQNATKSIPSPDWDGFWSGMISTGIEWKWSDQTGVYYFNWRAGEPNNWQGQMEDCVEIYNDGSWNDDPCENELPFVCKDRFLYLSMSYLRYSII